MLLRHTYINFLRCPPKHICTIPYAMVVPVSCYVTTSLLAISTYYHIFPWYYWKKLRTIIFQNQNYFYILNSICPSYRKSLQLTLWEWVKWPTFLHHFELRPGMNISQWVYSIQIDKLYPCLKYNIKSANLMLFS